MIKDTKEQLLVDQTIRIEAPQEAVFALLTEPAQMQRWFPVTVFEPKVGGAFGFEKGEFVCFGEVVEFDPPRVVAYTWDYKKTPIGSRTIVRYDLRKDGSGTVVHLTHTGFVDAEWASDHRKGWTYYLGRLKTVGEGGDPGPDDKM
jgi:uncharacterized protein YndB with AHSA1/START domain